MFVQEYITKSTLFGVYNMINLLYTHIQRRHPNDPIVIYDTKATYYFY